MKIQPGNLWEFHEAGHWVCVTTNGVVGKKGLVMGKGVALEASTRFPDLKEKWGEMVQELGNIPVPYMGRLLSFPTKHHWRDNSDIDLIAKSAHGLAKWLPFIKGSCGRQQQPFLPICLPMVGCGNGNLDWNSQVLPVLSSILTSDDYLAITHEHTG